MDKRAIQRKILHVTNGFQEYHDHVKYDPATGENYFMRLPDGSPVSIASYERRKKEILEFLDHKNQLKAHLSLIGSELVC